MNSVTKIGIIEVVSILGDKSEYEVTQFASFGPVTCNVKKPELESNFIAHAEGGEFVAFTAGPLFESGMRVGFVIDDKAGRRFRVGI